MAFSVKIIGNDHDQTKTFHNNHTTKLKIEIVNGTANEMYTLTQAEGRNCNWNQDTSKQKRSDDGGKQVIKVSVTPQRHGHLRPFRSVTHTDGLTITVTNDAPIPTTSTNTDPEIIVVDG